MTFNDIIRYYGSKANACYALGIARANFSQWVRQGYIPLIQQLRLERLSLGKLKAQDEHTYSKRMDA